VTWGRLVVFSVYSGFLHQYNWPPWYNWNIVESGIKHHNHNPNPPHSDGHRIHRTVMVSNSTNLKKSNNHLPPQAIHRHSVCNKKQKQRRVPLVEQKLLIPPEYQSSHPFCNGVRVVQASDFCVYYCFRFYPFSFDRYIVCLLIYGFFKFFFLKKFVLVVR
jgi:hypothetical protein